MVSPTTLVAFLLAFAAPLVVAQSDGDSCEPDPTTTASTLLTSTTTSSAAPTVTSTIPFSVRGYLYGYTAGAQVGCLITAGTWYKGTCAYYTPVPVAGGFIINTSKGACDIVDNALVCGGSTSGVFNAIGNTLTYNGESQFYAAVAPNPAQTVSLLSNAVPVTFQYSAVAL